LSSRKRKRTSSGNKPRVSYMFDVELDLHGYTGDEAVYLLEEQVIVNADSSILVIHGHGGGVLREAVRSFARSDKNVKDYSFGEDINLIGGSGATVLYTL